MNVPKTKEEVLELVNQNNGTIKFSRTKTTGEERSLLTIFAEQCDFATFIENNEFLVITNKTDNFPIDIIDDIPEDYLKSFSEYVGITIYKDKFSESLKLYNVINEWNIFINEIKKYGIQGYKRRNIIFIDHIVNIIKNSAEYQLVTKNKPKMIPIKHGIMSKIGSVAGKFYSEDNCINKNPNLVWITIDARAAIYQGYRDLNICQEKDWKQFISNYTKSKTLIDSKHLRLVIFGKLNSEMKCNQLIINNSIIKNWNKIADTCKDVFFLMEGDEIILKCNDDNYIEYMKKIKEFSDYNDVKVSCLKLSKHEIIITDTSKKTFYVKEYIKNENSNCSNLTYEIKCIEPEYKFSAHEYISKYIIDNNNKISFV